MGLQVEKLDYSYRRGRPVLVCVSGEFEAGRVTAVVGPNGCGKSTLLRAMMGALGPTGGRVRLDGRAVSTLGGRERAARMGYLSQRPGVSGGFSLREVVAMGRFALRRDDGAVDSALVRVGLADRAAESFATLSAGQQQRGALARVLAQMQVACASGDGARPGGTRVILADEPVSAMDPKHTLETMETLREQARQGLAVVVVLHDFTLARRVADWAVALEVGGTVAAAGPVAEVLEPGLLGRVFGVGFEQAQTDGGPVLIPGRVVAARAEPPN